MSNLETFRYDNRIVRAFAIATVIWAFVGTAAGLLAACQLFWPGLNLDTPFLTFGRIRPLHTNAVIFAFVGNAMFMGIYYSLQRLCKARMFSDALSWFNFWGWNGIIVAAAGRGVPQALLDQLKVGGHLVLPVESSMGWQHLEQITKTGEDEFEHRNVLGVRFVPLLTGKR